ncbi:hypothetical protein Taro_006471 [Colocasia esculenta]|uniref:Uncharacterized protein n=1 Tax=Colocasia esculenta TaxID=4460 RepID=A0A843TW18_COLES|nr:hypothetical protein [Colocasia esculenta]
MIKQLFSHITNNHTPPTLQRSTSTRLTRRKAILLESRQSDGCSPTISTGLPQIPFRWGVFYNVPAVPQRHRICFGHPSLRNGTLYAAAQYAHKKIETCNFSIGGILALGRSARNAEHSRGGQSTVLEAAETERIRVCSFGGPPAPLSRFKTAEEREREERGEATRESVSFSLIAGGLG